MSPALMSLASCCMSSFASLPVNPLERLFGNSSRRGAKSLCCSPVMCTVQFNALQIIWSSFLFSLLFSVSQRTTPHELYLKAFKTQSSLCALRELCASVSKNSGKAFFGYFTHKAHKGSQSPQRAYFAPLLCVLSKLNA